MATSLKELQHDQQERLAAIQRARTERENREKADWELYCADPEGARQRATAERVQQVAETRKQQQTDWSAFWQTIDQRIAQAIGAQGTFSRYQQEVLGEVLNDVRNDMLNDMGEQTIKAIEDLRRAIDARFETLERRARAPGSLPPVKVWRQGMVAYEGQMVTFGGSIYQAATDVGASPGDEPETWTQVAQGGRDAAPILPLGQWTTGVSYAVLSLVTHQGCSYLATQNDPGRPGDGESGWQAVAAKGAKGDPGPRGPRGNRGERGEADTRVTIVAWSLDVENYRACPALNNGEVGAILDLRPLFAQFGRETGTA